MTTDVKRWDTGVYGIQYMQQDPNGAFVEHEDYQALLAENERLRAAIERRVAENERMRAESARLRRSLNEAVVHGNRQSGKAERLDAALRYAREYVETALHDERARFAGFEHCSEIGTIEADLAVIDAALAGGD